VDRNRTWNFCGNFDRPMTKSEPAEKERDPGVPATARDIALISQQDSRQISAEDAD
jgi:hypothetical protein